MRWECPWSTAWAGVSTCCWSHSARSALDAEKPLGVVLQIASRAWRNVEPLSCDEHPVPDARCMGIALLSVWTVHTESRTVNQGLWIDRAEFASVCRGRRGRKDLK